MVPWPPKKFPVSIDKHNAAGEIVHLEESIFPSEFVHRCIEKVNILDFLKVRICENREIFGRSYNKFNEMVGLEKTRFKPYLVWFFALILIISFSSYFLLMANCETACQVKITSSRMRHSGAKLIKFLKSV